MSVTQEAIVIVGAGQAGGRAAEALRDAGFGGRVTLIGEEAEPPYERPALSKGLLLGDAPAQSTYLHPRDYYAGRDIELVTGVRVEAIAPTTQRLILSDGRALAYDKLLLATGSRVRPFPGAPERLDGVHYLRTLNDSRRLAADLLPGRRMVVIGGGFIGLEVAASAVKLGLSVTVVERQPALLERAVPAAVAAAIERMHREHGVNIRLDAAVTRIQGDDDRVSMVELASGELLAVDLVVIGIGIIPNTELAEGAGAQSSDGLLVDEFGRTTLANVWAAGDVTNHPNPILGRRVRLESWQNAQNQAIAVAKNMVGPLAPYAEVPWFWSDQYDVNIQMLGVADTAAPICWRGDPASGRALAFAFDGERACFAIAFNWGGEMRFVRRLIETGAAVSPAVLADTGRKLKDIAAEFQRAPAVAGA